MSRWPAAMEPHLGHNVPVARSHLTRAGCGGASHLPAMAAVQAREWGNVRFYPPTWFHIRSGIVTLWIGTSSERLTEVDSSSEQSSQQPSQPYPTSSGVPSTTADPTRRRWRLPLLLVLAVVILAVIAGVIVRYNGPVSVARDFLRETWELP